MHKYPDTVRKAQASTETVLRTKQFLTKQAGIPSVKTDRAPHALHKTGKL